jgi:hypothetical protein
MSRRHRSALLAGALAIMLLAASPVVSAALPAAESQAACSWQNHCYATMRWSHGDVSGAEVELGTYSLNVPGTGPDFETSEMWVGFDGSPISWIEAGVSRDVGTVCSGTNWFSAASYPLSGGYQLRCLGAATLNTKAWVRLQEGSGSWSFYRDGTNLSTWALTPSTTSFLEVGHEYTRSDVSSSMTAGWMKWRHTVNNNWYTGWDTPSYPAPAANPGGWPCYTMWVARPKDMRARCNIAPAAQEPQAIEQNLTPQLSLTKEARRIAGSMGVTDPRNVRSVNSDRVAVNGMFNADIRAEGGLAVIQIDGDFLAHGVPRPQGAASPTGKSLTVVLDQATGQVRMIHLWPSAAPDLAVLGEPTTIF